MYAAAAIAAALDAYRVGKRAHVNVPPADVVERETARDYLTEVKQLTKVTPPPG